MREYAASDDRCADDDVDDARNMSTCGTIVVHGRLRVKIGNDIRTYACCCCFGDGCCELFGNTRFLCGSRHARKNTAKKMHARAIELRAICWCAATAPNGLVGRPNCDYALLPSRPGHSVTYGEAGLSGSRYNN